jgi:hypothetical protein
MFRRLFFVVKVLAVIPVVMWLSDSVTANLEETKANAVQTWRANGYEPIGYEGYGWGLGFGTYGGAKVWHSLRSLTDDRGVRFSGYVQRWGNEYHIYGPKAIDAIGGDK